MNLLGWFKKKEVIAPKQAVTRLPSYVKFLELDDSGKLSKSSADNMVSVLKQYGTLAPKTFLSINHGGINAVIKDTGSQYEIYHCTIENAEDKHELHHVMDK